MNTEQTCPTVIKREEDKAGIGALSSLSAESGEAHTDMKALLEAAIFISATPVSIERLSQLFSEDARPSNVALEQMLNTLEEEYRTRSIRLQKVAAGYRFQVEGALGLRLASWLEEHPTRLSRALIETLALIAYRQPITRGEIEDIRGVSVSSHTIRTLQERDWIKPIGQRDVPGKPVLYGTTTTFLQDLNLENLSQLPSLPEIGEEHAAAEQLSLALEPALVS
jgi:segregation and condensation protein B